VLVRLISGKCARTGPGMGVARRRYMMFSRPTFLALIATLGVAGCAAPEPESGAGAAGEATALDGARFDFEPGAEQAQPEASKLSVKNALWLSRLSRLVYTDLAQIPAELTKLGIPQKRFVPFDVARTGTQGFYLHTGSVGFVIFRGTEPTKLRDLLTDADGVRRIQVGPSAILAHHGFTDAVESVWPAIRKELLAQKGPVYFGGHSMGGSLAVVASYKALFDGCSATRVPGDFQGQTRPWAESNITVDRTRDASTGAYKTECLNKFIPVSGVYTFGQPAAGNNEFADTLDWRMRQSGTAYFRFINRTDPVPDFSPASSFSHVGADYGRRNVERVAFLAPDGTLRVKTLAGRTGPDCGTQDFFHDHDALRYIKKAEKASLGAKFSSAACAKEIEEESREAR
jgi:Lipase (class 3)